MDDGSSKHVLNYNEDWAGLLSCHNDLINEKNLAMFLTFSDTTLVRHPFKCYVENKRYILNVLMFVSSYFNWNPNAIFLSFFYFFLR